jgi:hypothetical protein
MNGNPTGPDAPNMKESIVSGALIYLFFGTRFIVEEDGTVTKIDPAREIDGLPLTDIVKFHPKHCCAPLLEFVEIGGLVKRSPELVDKHERDWCLRGVCFLSGQELIFFLQHGQLKVRII